LAKYLARTCPKCKDYLGALVRDPPEPKTEIPIDAYCCRCGFKLDGKVVLGKKSPLRSASTALFLLTVFAPSCLTHFSVLAIASHKPGLMRHIVTRVVDGDILGDVASERALWQLVEMPREARLDEGAQRGKRVFGSNVP
jgi:uncharacterized paraquat-inducible protein A